MPLYYLDTDPLFRRKYRVTCMHVHQEMITILSDVGGLYKIISFFILLPLGLALYTQDWINVAAFFLIICYFAAAGNLLDKLPQYREYTKLSSALASLALAWLTSGIVFGIPYYICTDMTISQSIFEGMAGWTRTNFSFLPIGEIHLSSSLFFWRAYTQWIGGLAMLSVFISLMKGVQYSSFHQSMHERRQEHIITSLQVVIRKIIPYYLIFSFIAWCAIFANNVPFLDSIYLMLSSVSTGGFIPYPENIMYYDSISLEMTLICIMIISSLPLPLFFVLFFHKKIAALKREKQILLLFCLILSCTFIITCAMISGLATGLSQDGNPDDIGSIIRYGLFMSVSAATTTGFWNTSIEGWGDVNLILIMLLMFIGGSNMSMAGGIKLRRVLLWFAGVTWWVRQIFAPPHAMTPLFFEGERIGSKEANVEISKSAIVIVSSVLLIGISVLLFMHIQPNADVLSVIFDVTSAFATSGLSLGHVTPDMPLISMWIMIFLMWAGTLEVLPVIMLILVLFRSKDA